MGGFKRERRGGQGNVVLGIVKDNIHHSDGRVESVSSVHGDRVKVWSNERTQQLNY